jgi:NitT/TauT family transport system permease protein
MAVPALKPRSVGARLADHGRPSGRPRRRRARPRDRLLSLALLLALLAFWQWGLPGLGVPSYLVSTPSATAQELWHGYIHGDFFMHTWVTLKEIVVGFAAGVALGFGLGVLLSQWALLNRLLSPYVIALNSMPKVAIAPLLVVWFGQGLVSKVIVTALVAFFPLLINVTAGLRSVNSEQLELMRSLTATRWQIFTKLQFRHGLPQIFAGLEIAIVLAVVGAVVGEFVGAQAGLGYYLQLSLSLVNPPGMFAMLVVLAAISWVMYEIVHQLGRRIVFWERSNRTPDGV